MGGVKVALGNRGVTVEAARQYAKDRKVWRALVKVTEWVLLGIVFFRTTLPCSGGYHREGWDACNKGETTENQGARLSVKYTGYGVYVDNCVLSDLTSLTLLGGRSNSWFIVIINK